MRGSRTKGTYTVGHAARMRLAMARASSQICPASHRRDSPRGSHPRRQLLGNPAHRPRTRRLVNTDGLQNRTVPLHRNATSGIPKSRAAPSSLLARQAPKIEDPTLTPSFQTEKNSAPLCSPIRQFRHTCGMCISTHKPSLCLRPSSPRHVLTLSPASPISFVMKHLVSNSND